MAEEFIIPDYSHWQGLLDFDIIESVVEAMYFKASEALSTDSQFTRNKAEATDRNLRWGAYHFFRANVDPRQQARYFAMLIGHYDAQGRYVFDSKLRPVLDVEARPWYYSTSTMQAKVRDFVQEFFVITGVYVWIYTRKSWWDVNVARSNYFYTRCKLMVAHYNSYILRPDIPLDWSNYLGLDAWDMWQFSADGNGLGSMYGAKSNSVDLSRYKGGREKFVEDYPELFTDEPDPCEDCPCDCPECGDGEYTIFASQFDGLRVRDNIIPSLKYGPTPGTVYKTSTVWFKIDTGDQVRSTEEIVDGNNVWCVVGKNQVVAKRYDDVNYLA